MVRESPDQQTSLQSEQSPSLRRNSESPDLSEQFHGQATNLTAPLVPYLKALMIVVSFTGIAHIMSNAFDLANVVMIYLLGVVIVAGRYSRGPAILASVLSVAAFDFFFVPPQWTFAVSDTQYLVTFAVMLGVALFISTLTVRIRQQAESAILREARTAALYSMSRELASTAIDKDSIIENGLRHIKETFDCDACLFLVTPSNDLVAEKQAQDSELQFDIGIAAWVHEYRQSAGLGMTTLPGVTALYIPIIGAERPIGVLAVRPSRFDRFASPDQLKLLDAFGNQMALACERALLSEENERSRLQVKTEQLRNSLLSSISHDLRTPLATITGAASSIINATERLDVSTCRDLVIEIHDESRRLNRLVSNLLDMTKLQSGSLRINKELHPLEEIVGAALSCLEERLLQHKIKTSLPPDLPFVVADGILIQQLLVNLIENAVKYTPEGSNIEISAKVADDMVLVTIADNGPGIPNELKEKIFEPFFRAQSGQKQSSAGEGLGLAICTGIMEAHGGRLTVSNSPAGGAAFSFSLPGKLSDKEVFIAAEESLKES